MQCVARFLQLPTEEALVADATPGPHTLGLVGGAAWAWGGRQGRGAPCRASRPGETACSAG